MKDRDFAHELSRHEEPPIAAHLVSSRGFYTHHGIYVGNGRVIHYSGYSSGLSHGRGPVEEVSLEEFTRGRVTWVCAGPAVYDSKEVVQRARTRLGEDRYRLLNNNCRHFCEWCRCGA